MGLTGCLDEFKWKPGDVKSAPGWCAPHQPRLDWQMWFAALGTPRENPWFVALIFRLLQGSNEVNGLLANNPFPDKRPRYVRAMFYRYRFTTVDELRQTGAWWKRDELREYLPTLSLERVPLMVTQTILSASYSPAGVAERRLP